MLWELIGDKKASWEGEVVKMPKGGILGEGMLKNVNGRHHGRGELVKMLVGGITGGGVKILMGGFMRRGGLHKCSWEELWEGCVGKNAYGRNYGRVGGEAMA